MKIKVININSKEERCIKRQYDFLPKYCLTCKLQGRNEDECRSLHPKIRKKLVHDS